MNKTDISWGSEALNERRGRTSGIRIGASYAAYPAAYPLAAHTLHRMIELGPGARTDMVTGAIRFIVRRVVPMCSRAPVASTVLVIDIDSFGPPKGHGESLEGTRMRTALWVKAPRVIAPAPE